jgi:orsellinic acid C2-O-methyltransferase
VSDDPRARAQRLVSGFRGYQLVVAACRLKVPDLVAGGPRTADELAAATGTHAPSLHRMLRGLAAWQVFVEQADGRFAATPLSDMFRSDRPGLRNLAIMLSEEGYQVWGELMHVLETGQPAYERVFGKARWEHLADHPASSAQFNAAMVETSNRVGLDFVASYDFDGARTVVDVGGGSGALLAAVLRAHPEMQGVLFDVAAGLEGARESMQAADLQDRVTFVEGSFFESVPGGGDVYLLKSIVHDWEESKARQILKACRTAMKATSKVVLVERDVPERIDDPDSALQAAMLDLHMMVVLGGRERTPGEYAELLAGAGLHLNRRIPLGTEFVAFEAVPV